MKNTLLITTVFVLCAAFLSAITPSEVFNDGLRAFNNARYLEAEEIFQRFIETWPSNKLADDAIYYSSIACVRSLKARRQNAVSDKLTEIENNMITIAKQNPETDLNELKVALSIAEDWQKPKAWQQLAALSPTELKHYVNRSWYPSPSKNPMQTLSWLKDWQSKNGAAIDPNLSSRLSLIEAQALWKLILSPLASHENSKELKTLGYENIYSAFEGSLKKGFAAAEPAVKRQFALLGYHFDVLKQNGLPQNFAPNTKSRWYNYLRERGLALREAYCP